MHERVDGQGQVDAVDQGWLLAIDFGTTYTTAAMASGNRVEVVDVDGLPRMPSVVLASDSGGLIVGNAAEQQLAVAPERAERTPKRRIGDEIMLLGSRPVEPAEAVAAVLGAIASEAIRRQGGVAPSEVRLTHPARWGSVRLTVLSRAAEMAGLGRPLLIAEPVAAAVHFADERIAEGDHVAVYDLGGGTFDTAVLRRRGEGFEVVGPPGGDERLGGEVFDERLLQHLGARLGERQPETWEALRFNTERQWRKAGHDFRTAVRKAKEALSTNADYTIYLGAPVDAELLVTRDELEDLIRTDIETTVAELEATVTRAGLALSELSAVSLVGGSSRIPLVTRLVADRLGHMPDTWGDPKAAVALGAARATRLTSVPGTGSLDGAPVRRAAPLPTVIGGNEIVAELGRGGMGVVYLARQPSLARLVAVKTLPTLDSSLTARLEREAAVLAELQHPHIATVLDVGVDEPATYVVMPFFVGGTVANVLERDGRLPAGQVSHVLAAVAEALAATHARGFLHRDVKPSNMLLSAEGEPYLADFGLAFPLLDSSRLTNSRSVLGTVPYTAPEIIADAAPARAADTYALGVCGYQLLSGRLPYQGSNVLSVLDSVRRGASTPLGEVVPDAPPELVRLVTEAFDPDPAARPTDLRAWAAAIRAAASPVPVRPAPPAAWAEAIAAASRPAPVAPAVVAPVSGVDTAVTAGGGEPVMPATTAKHNGPENRRARTLVAAAVLVVVALIAGVAMAAAGGDGGKPDVALRAGATTTSTAVPDTTTAPAAEATTVPAEAPTAAPAPETAPPAVATTLRRSAAPVTTRAQSAQPPVTQPPVTQPPVTQPPATQPPATQPPVTQAPTTTTTTIPMVARNDSYDYTVEVCGGVWCEALLKVLVNDSGNYDWVDQVSSPAHGDIRWDGPGGYWGYTPHHNGFVQDSFQYRLRNTTTGQVSAPATVSVTLRCNTAYSCF